MSHGRQVSAIQRRWLLAALSLGLLDPVWAQSRVRRDARAAAPFLNPAEFVSQLLALHFVPAAQAFAHSTAGLQRALAGACTAQSNLQRLREHWRAAMLDWELLSAVAVGPLLERRAARSLDFAPTRPEMIRSAVSAQIPEVAALERVGAPAKGLPALEWLLWQPRLELSACRYASLLAQDCAAQAQAIASDFQALSARAWDDEVALPMLQDWVGQTVAGLALMRNKRLAKPLLLGRHADWGRATSGSTRRAWLAHWAGLQRVLLGANASAELGSLNGLLRGRGLLVISAQLENLVLAIGPALQQAQPDRPASVNKALRHLDLLVHLVEDQAAPALDIVVGFSDDDGD